MPKRLYVGNLNYTTTEASLSDLFGTVGEVLSVHVVTDRMTGQSRGFAFVEMAERADADRAIGQLNGQVLDGRAIRVAEAKPRDNQPFRQKYHRRR
ncbi:MAG TPA: RNA-binding protein [Thermoflexia bacterium]|jgi:RNA recognition motif-containing protein|nr:RNA-binding protein [Thermoflexia bacterium]HID88819.1 RNA-binding protein [Anaerolineae bacterium]